VNSPRKLRIATRKSPLALWQAERVAFLLQTKLEVQTELLPMSTTGDRQAQWNLAEKGGKGLFTKELEDALIQGDADLAVHSAKDMPTECPSGLSLSAFVERDDPRDVLILKDGMDTPKVMATGSPRRQAQLKDRFPQCEWIQLRGNVETRLRKIAEQDEADGTILAAAGLARLGLTGYPGLKFMHLPVSEMVPAAGQGAIAIQTRSGDKDEYVRLGNPTTQKDVSIERHVLESQGGGCQIALGVCVQQGNLHFFEEGAGYLSFSCNEMSESEIMKQIKDFYR
jgi:hydroxymethylbilane synthase